VEALRTLYQAAVVSDTPTLLDRPLAIDRSRLPGKPADPAPAARDAVEAKLRAALRMLFVGKRGCLECHAAIPPELALVDTASVAAVRIEPPGVPRLWLPEAEFSHDAHRDVTCTECHAGATISQTRSDVLIPRLEACLRCHASEPRRMESAAMVASSCTMCHRYHPNSPRGLPGAAALSRVHGVDRSAE
jgi:hypothetical protein